MSIQQQVSRAIRILRGNRDVSARASHLVVQQDQLMTYESVLVGQAEMEKFSKSTFSERKIMSTKTSIKRIAAVAAVALTLGGFSAVSAHATAQADTLAVSAATATALPGAAASVTVTQTYLSTGTTDLVTATASIVSMPSGNATLPTLVSVTTNDKGSPRKVVSGLVATTDNVASGTFVSANYTLSLTTQTVGTYVIKVTPQTASSATAVTVTFTIADTASTASAKGSRVYMRAGDSANGAASLVLDAGGYAQTAKDDSSYTNAQLSTALGTQIAAQDLLTTTNVATLAASGAISTAGTVVANFGVILSNNDTITSSTLVGAVQQVAAPYAPIATSYFNAAGHPVTMTVSGPGWVKYAGAIKGKTYTEVSTDGQVNYVQKSFYLVSDGTTGLSTITFTADGVTLKTFTVNFFGTAAKITPTVATPVLVVGTNTAAITAIVADASGVPVSGQTVYVVSATAAAVSNSYTACTATSDATGKVSCNLTGVAAGTSSITLTLNASSAGTSTVTSAAVSVRVGSATAATYTISTDKASYLPGEVATVSILMKDSTGLAVTDSTAVGGALTSTYALTTNAFSATGTPTAGTGNGTYSFTVNMPINAGDVKLTFTPTTTTLTATSVTVSVGGDSASTAAQAAVDAANEATDAANAATDAANNAMDSADAAQQAALDAGDKADAALAAVTDLASKVADIATQISALSSLVSKIAASVAKISAKVKA